MRELFATARRTVLIASYALDRGDKARDLFGGLAARMDEEQALQVRMFVNVRREHGSEVPDSVVLRQFADAFRADIWPGSRLPEVFFSLAAAGAQVRGTTLTQPSLESLFIKLTGNELRE